MPNFQSFEVLSITVDTLFHMTKLLIKLFLLHLFRCQVTFFLKGGYQLLIGRKTPAFHPQFDVGEKTKLACLDYMQGVPFPQKTPALRMPNVQVYCHGGKTKNPKAHENTKFSKSWGKQVFVHHLAVTVLDFSSKTVVRIPSLVKTTVTICLPIDFDLRTCTGTTSSSKTQTLLLDFVGRS